MDKTWSALIVDDDPGIRQSIRLCLEADNARVLGVGTSAGALEALERSAFDVVFLDLWLQDESGLAVLPEILRRQPGAASSSLLRMPPSRPQSRPCAWRRRLSAQAVYAGAGARRGPPHRLSEDPTAAGLRTARTYRRLRPRNPLRHAQPRLPRFLQAAERVAAVDSVVLLRGESGTGKTVLARWLRAQPPRRGAVRDRPLSHAVKRTDVERAVWPRQGGVHRRRPRRGRQGAGGRGRHPVPRRGRRPQPRRSGPPAALSQRPHLRAPR